MDAAAAVGVKQLRPGQVEWGQLILSGCQRCGQDQADGIIRGGNGDREVGAGHSIAGLAVVGGHRDLTWCRVRRITAVAVDDRTQG